MSPVLGFPIVPLETLPGWPASPSPSTLEVVIAFIGIPVLVLVILALFVYAPTLARAARGQTRGNTGSLWLGSASSPKALATDAPAAEIGGAGRPASRESAAVHEDGVVFTPADIDRFNEALADADAQSGMDFSLFVGAPEGPPREFAEGLLSAQPEPARAVVVVVDPLSRAVEVATGTRASRVIDDADCALAAGEVQQAAADDELVSGIVDALNLLGNAAREIPALHTESEFRHES